MEYNPLKDLKIDYWYKILITVGTVVLLAGLTLELKIDNIIVVLISIGVILLGIGEWINHPEQTSIYPPGVILPEFTEVKSWKRKPNLLGTLFDILGFIIFAIGLYKIFYP